MLLDPRRLMIPWLLSLCAAGPLTACRKEKAEPTRAAAMSPEDAQRRAATARAALQELKPAFARLGDKLTALHGEFDPLPPGLPGFGETRSNFYSVSIALGSLSAKPAWLSARIEAAVTSRDRAELDAISKEVSDTKAQVQQAEGALDRLFLAVKPFKDAAAIKMEALQAQGKTTCE